MSDLTPQYALYRQIDELIEDARQQLQRTVNHTMVQTYWQIGRLIIEHEQQGESRAVYGTQQLETVSSRLTAEFGKGVDVTNLRNMRRFYEAFPIRDALRPELSWTHYRVLLRVNKPEAREWYMHEAALQNWSSRALERQIGTLYYERLLSSQDKTPVEADARAKTAPLAEDPRDYLRDPKMDMYVRLFEEQQRGEDDNPTIGLILCSQHNETVAQYSVLKGSKQLFASKYLTVLPREEELKRELERDRRLVEQRIEEQRGVYCVWIA